MMSSYYNFYYGSFPYVTCYNVVLHSYSTKVCVSRNIKTSRTKPKVCFFSFSHTFLLLPNKHWIICWCISRIKRGFASRCAVVAGLPNQTEVQGGVPLESPLPKHTPNPPNMSR